MNLCLIPEEKGNLTQAILCKDDVYEFPKTDEK
jgi:hypothetical protein